MASNYDWRENSNALIVTLTPVFVSDPSEVNLIVILLASTFSTLLNTPWYFYSFT